MRDGLTESQEDYLEAIYVIGVGERGVRSSEISDALRVKRPSVTTALKTLAEKGLVNYSPYDRISLTPAGESAARAVVARHGILRQFLVGILGIAPAVAEEEACRLEHAFTPAVFARFVQFINTLDRCPERTIQWDRTHGFGCGRGACVDCIAHASETAGSQQAGSGRLKDLVPGQEALVVGYRGESSEYRQQLLAMGLTRGTRLTVVKVAPLGDPVEIELRGFRLTVRKDEADALVVQAVDAQPGVWSRHHQRGRGHRHGWRGGRWAPR